MNRNSMKNQKMISIWLSMHKRKNNRQILKRKKDKKKKKNKNYLIN